MFKVVSAAFVLMAALTLGAPASAAGALELKPTKSEATCSCTPRHQAMMEIRDYRKELKAQEAEAAAAEINEGETAVPEEETQAGS